MANRLRGEIDAVIGGERFVLCLTLGALAELESRLEAGDLVGLCERFEKGRVSAGDLIALIGAGLRGGGNAISDDELARLQDRGRTGRRRQDRRRPPRRHVWGSATVTPPFPGSTPCASGLAYCASPPTPSGA